MDQLSDGVQGSNLKLLINWHLGFSDLIYNPEKLDGHKVIS